MQEKLGEKCSQEPEGFSSPDTLSPTWHYPISLSSVYPPWTQATESLMLSSCNEEIAFKPQIQTTWRESPGLPPVVLVRPVPSPTPSLHRRVFFPISQAILLGSLSHSPESLIMWAVSFQTQYVASSASTFDPNLRGSHPLPLLTPTDPPLAQQS